MTTIPLSKPIQAHGEELKALTLRAPVGRDLRTAGVPYCITNDGDIRVDAAIMAKMIGALASIPPSAVDALTAEDWQAAMMGVLGFFGTTLGGSST